MRLVVGRMVQLEAVLQKVAAEVVAGGQAVHESAKKVFVHVEVAQVFAQAVQGRLGGIAEQQPLEGPDRVGHDAEGVGGGGGQQGLKRGPFQADVPREHVHELCQRGLHGRGLKIKVRAAQAGRLALPLAEQLAHHQQVDLPHGREFEDGGAVEGSGGVRTEVLVAKPGGQAAPVLRALGEAIFVVHTKAGFRWPKLGTNGPADD